MPFTKLTGYTNLIANLPDIPGGNMTSAELKQYWDSSPEEARGALNKLIDDLQSTTAAETVGAKTVAGLTGSTVQALLESLKVYVDSQDGSARATTQSLINTLETQVVAHAANMNNPHRVTASQLNVYTKDELAPYLQGGDTLIRYEVFTVVNSNNADGTFTYKDKLDNSYVGPLTPEGHQVFSFKKGVYDRGLNRVECLVGDTLHRSVESGGLLEISNTEVALTIPEGNGAEITFKYFERIGITGEHNLVVGNAQPPASSGNTVWLKVVG